MADDKTKRTFTEDEHLAVLNDRVAKETAALTETVQTVTTERDELATKLDVETSAKTAAEQRATEAEKALEDFKAEIEQREAAAARKDERLGKVKEVAKHLGDDFFADETRVQRIVAMADDVFEGYVSDLAATATGAPASTTKGGTSAPRETAMQGAPGAGDGKAGSAGRSFLLRPYLAPVETKGA